MRFAFAVGTTETALVDGISAAGANPDVMGHTPSADGEILEFGRPVFAPFVPVSPSGCPTPSIITRAVFDHLPVDHLVVDAGLSERTAAPTISAGVRPGGDVRDPEPVPDAPTAFEVGRRLGRKLDEDLVIGESIPGGTTTALGVMTALGERHPVSSSLPANPIELKRSVVEEGLEASGIEAGDLAGEPIEAAKLMGDPVLPTVAGLLVGGAEAGRELTLAGGTQMIAAAALARHWGITAPISLATTTFVAEDDSTDLEAATDGLDLDLTVTDPGFDRHEHVAFERYRVGEAKEGVGMGGALMLADRAGVPMATIRDQIVERYEDLIGTDRNGDEGLGETDRGRGEEPGETDRERGEEVVEPDGSG